MSTDKPAFHVVIIRPQGYVHADAFLEIAETLVYGFRRLSCVVTCAENQLSKKATNIVLGANLFSEEHIAAIPANTIIYNFEQLSESSAWMTPALIKLFEKFQVWDYSKRNIEQLKKIGISENVRYVPLGYVEEMTRIPPKKEQDIDVLFYGSINPRREKIINDLKAAGLNVEALFGVYGKARDAYIARAKVIVNIHYYETNIFELVRVSYLLANKKAVVSEYTETTEIDEDFIDGVALAPYDQLVDKCKELIGSDELRHSFEKRGFQCIQAHDECEYLRQAIGLAESAQFVEGEIANSSRHPKKINIGSGRDYRPEYLNLDYSAYWKPDIVADLSAPELLGQAFSTQKFGEVALAQEAFEEIIANDVLEHIPDLVTAMTNCLKLLKDGGEFHIVVPYDLSYGAWQDPTHVRAFNERSWLYYTDWFWYLGWNASRFELASLTYNLSPLGKQLQEQGVSLEDILRQPRAVDAMSVILKKRALTDKEKQLVLK